MTTQKSNTNSFYWNTIEKFGNQALQFIIGIILARILSPNDYGLVGILLVFIAISQIFVDSGFTKALIQKNDKSKDDLSTAFTFNLGIAVFIYIILWFSAPFIAEFYNTEVLINLLRTLSGILIINALFTIPNTILTIDLDFKSIALINSISVFIGGIVSIYLAYTGFGVWALVIQYLLRATVGLILFSIKSKYKYKLYFSYKSFKKLFSFGSNLLISSVLSVIVDKFSSLFIAKAINTRELGFYTRGIQFPDIAIGTLGSVLDTVLLPTLAKTKSHKLLKFQLEKIINLLSLITLPITIILIVTSKSIIVFLLTEKWLPVVPIMQLFCISRFFTNLISVNVNLLYVLNKTNLALKQNYLKIVIRVGLIIAALQYGIVYIAAAEAFSAFTHYIINTYYPGKIINFGIKSQLKILIPYIVIGLFLFVILSSISSFIINDILNILTVSITGIITYTILLFLFKKKDLELAKNLITNIIK